MMALVMFERVENVHYVTWISRLNPVHSMGVVNGRFSGGYVVSGLGFCDLNSHSIFPEGTHNPKGNRYSTGACRAGAPGSQNTDANLPIMSTNLCQRFVELTLAFPRNVCRSLSSPMPKLDRGKRFCVMDVEYKVATAGDRNRHDCA